VGSGASSIYGDALHPYAWWETLSNNRPSTNHLIALTQSVVPTNVGDDIVFSTQYIASQHRVKFYWHNKTRHFARTITVTGTLDNTSSTETTPGHIAGYYTGNTAEAIDERAGTSDGHYYQNRQHGVTHWINVRVSNSSPTSSVAIRSQAHHGVIMTNVARTLHLDTPTAVSGYLTRFNSTWNHCGPYEAIP
jgi:hypothetical protein